MSSAAEKFEEQSEANARVRPFLKYAGGKTSLLPELEKRIPKVITGTYHEPMVGGGALYLHLASTGRLDGRLARIGDTNGHLLATWRAVQDDVGKVIARLAKMTDEESFYYDTRSLDPLLRKRTDAEVAAWTIYLNKTCFNGLWRVNKSGRFNVPYADKSPKRPARHLDRENLLAVADVLNRVKTEIEEADVATVLDYAKSGDVVYLDPPYVPVSDTSDFARYTVVGFWPKDQERLRDIALELKKRKVHVVLSNSIAAKDLFTDRRFKVSVVTAPRAINSVGSKRGPVEEIIVT